MEHSEASEKAPMTRRPLYMLALIVAVVLVACAAAVLAVSREAEATFPGKNGRIAYQDYSSFAIYAIDPDGSAKTKFVAPCTYPSLPDYSPDGKKIAYTSCEGTLGKDLGISTINVVGGGKVRVTHVTHNNTDEEEPSYSRDGKRIVYTGWDGHDTEIYTINSDGTGKTRLTDNGSIDQTPSYSPDGKRIVFAGAGRNIPFLPRTYDDEIYTIGVHGKNRVRLTDNATYYYPDYSPDGRRIAFAGTGENATRIYTIGAHGGDKSKVTNGYYPSYSPDGKKIAYSRGGDRDSAIYTIGVGGGGESKVTEGGYPSWGPRP